jgi:hypothetical protein
MRPTASKRVLMIALALALVAGMAIDAAAAGPYQRLPALNKSSKSLRIRFVRYTGGTNGRMIVDLRNTSRKSAAFTPDGLYFVPKVDPERAPQRLGAAGPFELDKQSQAQRKLTIAPGKTVRLRLQVFCLDSHRASPAASHRFRVAKKRLPKSLRKKIVRRARKAYDMNKSRGYRAQKSAMQSEIWRTRNAKWKKLEGERKNEKSSNKGVPRRRMQRQRIQLQNLSN